jgi:methionyl-tRNA formyltransferase
MRCIVHAETLTGMTTGRMPDRLLESGCVPPKSRYPIDRKDWAIEYYPTVTKE